MVEPCLTCGKSPTYDLICHWVCHSCARDHVTARLVELAVNLSQNPDACTGIFDVRCQEKCQDSAFLPYKLAVKAINSLLTTGQVNPELGQVARQLPDYFVGRFTKLLRCSVCREFTGFYADQQRSSCWTCGAVLFLSAEDSAKFQFVQARLQTVSRYTRRFFALTHPQPPSVEAAQPPPLIAPQQPDLSSKQPPPLQPIQQPDLSSKQPPPLIAPQQPDLSSKQFDLPLNQPLRPQQAPRLRTPSPPSIILSQPLQGSLSGTELPRVPQAPPQRVERPTSTNEINDIFGFLTDKLSKLVRNSALRIKKIRVISDPDDVHFFDQVIETQLFFVNPLKNDRKTNTVKRIDKPTKDVLVIEVPGDEEAAAMGIRIHPKEIKFNSAQQFLLRFAVQLR